MPWIVTAICEMFKTSCRTGKLIVKGRFAEPFGGPTIPSGSIFEYHPISAKHQARLHQFGTKFFPGIFIGYVLYSGGILQGDLVVDVGEAS